MPNWKEVLTEIHGEVVANPLDTVRRRYLQKVHQKTGRNVIAYYSGWLQRSSYAESSINDKDKSAFMVNIHKMDKSLGLDLILHTPGGDLAATESLIEYLHSIFGNDIRAVIPQISMSAGTMIALACKEVIMGKQSNLGPIDPQMGGVACQAVIEEFDEAKKQVAAQPASVHLWHAIVSKYHPTFLGACQKAIDWSKAITKDWLVKNMCSGDNAKADQILSVFAEHKSSKSHSRHLSIDTCKKAGLSVIEMEADNDLQDLLLTVHHAFMHTFNNSHVIKIVENHLGVAYMEHLTDK